jgi:hypothetical protein
VSANWHDQARRELLELRTSPCAWSYTRGGRPAVEPTVLACLALCAPADDRFKAEGIRIGHAAARWLAQIQRPDGRLPLCQAAIAPGWTTPHGILLWSALPGHEPARTRAIEWLLANRGDTGRLNPQEHPVVDHDLTLAGWPWVEGTHSWIEPTALAMLALARAGLHDHPRVATGARLILDRALPHGGWNCGNKKVFGHELRPQPVPTALSLLALKSCSERSGSEAVDRAVDFLLRAIPGLKASVSLGFSLLALRAHRAAAPDAGAALQRAFAGCSGTREGARSLAVLLLASAEHGLELLLPGGIP